MGEMPISGYGGYGGWGGGGYYGVSGLGTGYAGQFARSGGLAGAAVRSYAGRYQVNAYTTIGSQARNQGFGSYTEILAQIDQLTANVRKAMTDKYKVQF